MKKALIAIAFISCLVVLLSSCAGSRRNMGCPSHNPRYFRY